MGGIRTGLLRGFLQWDSYKVKRSQFKQLILEVIKENNFEFSPFVAFKDHNNKWAIYGLNVSEKYPDDYIRVDDPEKASGFSKEDVKKFSHRFIFGKSVEELNRLIKNKDHSDKHGSGKEGDIACPNCGYRYSIDPYNDDGLDPQYHTRINCSCGKTINVSVESIDIKYKVS